MNSKIKKGIRNLSFSLLTLSCLLAGTITYAQQTMSLGDLRFVLPNAEATLQSRTIRLKMSAADITSYYQIVGGIAFTQQAVPGFDIKSLDLDISEYNQTAYVNINGDRMVIPLEMYELQPIVNFADSEDNVAMTMYGAMYGQKNNIFCYDILFHPAFIDNMMGLHLLHVDAMIPLDGTNGQFPTYEDAWCLTDSEYTKYTEINKNLLNEGTSYIENAEMAYQEILSVTGDEFFSYIFTDIEQPISFYIDSGNIVFEGLPYYQFASIETDAVKLYNYFKDSAEILSSLQLDLSEEANRIIDILYSIENQSDKTEEQKAAEFMEKLENESGDPTSAEELFSAIFPIWASDNNITRDLRVRPDLVRALNPVVYDEVYSICQWAAFFRYVKAINPASWNNFVREVNQCDTKVPSLLTPISFASDIDEPFNYF